MKLTKEQIDEIVAALCLDDADRRILTSAFGERVNPWEGWRGSENRDLYLVPALFDAAAKVADGCDAEGFSMVGPDATAINRAAPKRIVDEIRGMA